MASRESLSWDDTFARLSAAQRAGPLDANDAERLAVAAYMSGRQDACEQAWTAAHREWLRRGDAARAAMCAFRQALGLFFRGDLAPATGWVARGRRVLSDADDDCVEQAWLRMLSALPAVFAGDAESVIRSSLMRKRSRSASTTRTRGCSRGSSAVSR